jgi:ATP-dependent DNA helicase RecG
MAKKKIFISSVQTEFSLERKALHEYICADPLLGKFFEPFLFELLPAIDQRADAVYLKEVEQSDIYLGLFGKSYGSENREGLSPTELEFNHATQWHKTRLVFLSDAKSEDRHPKENTFIGKAQEVLVRKKFGTVEELKASVYASLVRYLEEKEIIRTGPFDASLHAIATLQDIDPEKLKSFVRLAQAKRGFPLAETEPADKILTHLNIFQNNRLTNAALLLFGKEPQRFFINSEVRCASFAGTIMEKPIPSYKVFKGTLFELVDQALEFVLNKLDYRIETRAESVSIPGRYEVPKEVIAEAVVNAIAHRDYTSNASVQVMLFRDRLEIWNPGSLPMGWTTEKLKQLHTSVPANPLIAEPLYLAGYIERMGTGTTDIIQKSVAAGLAEPQFLQTEDFRSVIFRPATPQVTPEVAPEVTPEVTPEVKKLILLLEGEKTRVELQQLLELKDEKNFRENYQQKALKQEWIEMTIPDKPNSRKQKYRLTRKGVALQLQLKKKK